MQQLTLIHDSALEGKTTLAMLYRERTGLGANAYDNEAEDVDLFARIALGLRREQFFRAYRKNW